MMRDRLKQESENTIMGTQTYNETAGLDIDPAPLEVATFAFALEEYEDHYELYDDTQFPPARIAKPVSATVLNDMIVGRVTERAQIVANDLSHAVYVAESRGKLCELFGDHLDGRVGPGEVLDIADLVMKNFDVRPLT